MKQFPTHIVAVDGIIENGKDEVLLVRDAYRSTWTVPGGQVEVGENLIDALIREIKEESGVNVKVGNLICVSSNTGTHLGYGGHDMVPTKVMFGFVCTYIGGELCTSDETTEVKWVHKDEVLNHIRTPFLVERYLAYLNPGDGIKYLDYVTKPEYVKKLNTSI